MVYLHCTGKIKANSICKRSLLCCPVFFSLVFISSMPFKVIIILIQFMFLDINMFWALPRAHFDPRLMSLSRAAQNIFMPVYINSVALIPKSYMYCSQFSDGKVRVSIFLWRINATSWPKDEAPRAEEQNKSIRNISNQTWTILRSREAAFDRVQGSVNKQLEDMLLKEYPEEYVQNNAGNWLNIQQNIAFIIKGQQATSTRSCEISPWEKKVRWERQMPWTFNSSRTWRCCKQLNCWKLPANQCLAGKLWSNFP